jgi:hypothetical protein
MPSTPSSPNLPDPRPAVLSAGNLLGLTSEQRRVGDLVAAVIGATIVDVSGSDLMVARVFAAVPEPGDVWHLQYDSEDVNFDWNNEQHAVVEATVNADGVVTGLVAYREMVDLWDDEADDLVRADMRDLLGEDWEFGVPGETYRELLAAAGVQYTIG